MKIPYLSHLGFACFKLKLLTDNGVQGSVGVLEAGDRKSESSGW